MIQTRALSSIGTTKSCNSSFEICGRRGTDEINHHYRRYRLGELKTLIQQAGLQLQVSSYFNTWLFPAVALIRVVRRWLKLEDKNQGQSDENHSDDLKVPMPLINHALIQLFGSERFLVQKPGLPFGVSAIVLARK
jgi:hypothetical protein